jgi:hypothetical protein
MPGEANSRLEGRYRYADARGQATREDFLARLAGRPVDLIPFEAIAHVLRSYQHLQLTEQRLIPIDRIIGSVGRYRDFTRSFKPRAAINADRWSSIDVSLNGQQGFPPIEVYQIGDVYFVADGNHRVSVARANGLTEIEAFVTLIPGDPGLEPGDSLDEAIVKVERSHFLAQTRLAETVAEPDLDLTRPGAYTRLLEHIYAHRHFLLRRDPKTLALTFPEVAIDWYQRVYLRMLSAIRQHDLPARFPGLTAGDLYVWLTTELVDLSSLQDQRVSPEEAALLLEKRAPNPVFATLLRLLRHLPGVEVNLAPPTKPNE